MTRSAVTTSRPRAQPRPRCGGIALLSVLWILTLLSVIAAGTAATTRSESQLVRNLIAEAQATQAAEGGLELAVFKLMAPSAERWPADGSVQHAAIGDAKLRIAVFDERGKIDINFADANLLDRLFANAGVDGGQRAALVDAIMDWRDSDDLRRLNGAEDEDYRSDGKSYGARDAPFTTADELLLVLGMEAHIYEAIAPLITVYSRSRQVVLSVAAPDVRAVVGDVGPAGEDSALPIYTVNVEASMADGVTAQLAATIVSGQVTERSSFGVMSWRQPAERLFPADDALLADDPVGVREDRFGAR